MKKRVQPTISQTYTVQFICVTDFYMRPIVCSRAETVPTFKKEKQGTYPVMDHPDDRGSDGDQHRSSQPQHRPVRGNHKHRNNPSQLYPHSPQYTQSGTGQRRQYTQDQSVAMADTAGPMVHPQEMDYHNQSSGYPMHQNNSAPQHHYPPIPGVQQSSSYGLHQQQAAPPPHYSHQAPQYAHSQTGYHPQQLGGSAAAQTHHHYTQQAPPYPHHHQHMMMDHQSAAQPPRGPPQPSYNIQPTVGRLPADRPIVKLSLSLIETYKRINEVYYEERDMKRRLKDKDKQEQRGQGVNNNGWDDEHYDYILTDGETFNSRYIIKERIGKGSFGQVVRAVDTETKSDVAIKIIKSKKPFQMQAKTEIELLTHLREKDRDDSNNIGKLTCDKLIYTSVY